MMQGVVAHGLIINAPLAFHSCNFSVTSTQHVQTACLHSQHIHAWLWSYNTKAVSLSSGSCQELNIAFSIITSKPHLTYHESMKALEGVAAEIAVAHTSAANAAEASAADGWEEDLAVDVLLGEASQPAVDSRQPTQLHAQGNDAAEHYLKSENTDPAKAGSTAGQESPADEGGWESGLDINLPEVTAGPAREVELGPDASAASTNESSSSKQEAFEEGQSRTSPDGWNNAGLDNQELVQNLKQQDSQLEQANASQPKEIETTSLAEEQPEVGEDLRSDQASSEADGEASETGLSPIHSCWVALMQRQLSFGCSDLVLRAVDQAEDPLTTAEEFRDLIQAGSNRGTHVFRFGLCLLSPVPLLVYQTLLCSQSLGTVCTATVTLLSFSEIASALHPPSEGCRA